MSRLSTYIWVMSIALAIAIGSGASIFSVTGAEMKLNSEGIAAVIDQGAEQAGQDKKQEAITLSKGSYVPYTVRDKFTVAATILANPSRLNSVSMGYVYSPTAIKAADDSALETVYHGISKGQIFLSAVDDTGSINIDVATPNWFTVLPEKCKQTAEGAVSDECTEYAKKILEVAIHANKKIMASRPDVLPDSAYEMKVINWSATEPILPTKLTDAAPVAAE